MPAANQTQARKAVPPVCKGGADASAEFLELLAERLPPVVARKDIERVLGGVVAMHTLTNADAAGAGPEVAYRVGRSVVYRTDSLLSWLAARFEIRRIANLKAL